MAISFTFSLLFYPILERTLRRIAMEEFLKQLSVKQENIWRARDSIASEEDCKEE